MYYSEEEARKTVIEAGLRLVREKLIARTWGNISARISDTQFIITPSGRSYDSLKTDDLVKVNIADLSYEGNIKPSSEKGIHAACYALRKDVGFVIHTHQEYASIIGILGKDTDFAPCAGYAFPGTPKLWKKVTQCIEKNPSSYSFLMFRHGALCLGSDYADAFEKASVLEEKSKALFEKNKVEASPEKKKKCFIDDYAQIVGPCGNPDPNEDKDAVEMISEKNALAACYTAQSKPMSFFDALLQKRIYRKKYSKLKESNR